jgi:hypothetical protein
LNLAWLFPCIFLIKIKEMLMNYFLSKTLIIFSLLLISSLTFALTDDEARDQGMTSLEDYLLSEMSATITPGLNKEGVARAVQSHRYVIAINKAAKGKEAQTLRYFENGVEILKEKISTGREKEEKAKSGRIYFSTTPKGYFRPTKIYKDYMSYTWKAPMPNSVFIVGGIALHATDKSQYKALGTRASGGCIRTTMEISKFIREKVMESGKGHLPGQYEIMQESQGRNLITKNSVLVDKINKQTGDIINGKINSWDTVVIVYEE